MFLLSFLNAVLKRPCCGQEEEEDDDDEDTGQLGQAAHCLVTVVISRNVVNQPPQDPLPVEMIMEPSFILSSA